MGVISSAKILFKNKEDEVCAEQLETALTKVAQAIKMVVYGVKDLQRGTIVREEITEPPMRTTSQQNTPSIVQNTTDISPIPEINAAKERERIMKLVKEKKKEQDLLEKRSKSQLPAPLTPQKLAEMPKSSEPKEITKVPLSKKVLKELQKKEKE